MEEGAVRGSGVLLTDMRAVAAAVSGGGKG